MDIAEAGQPWQQRMILKDDAAIRSGPGDFPPGTEQKAFRRLDETCASPAALMRQPQCNPYSCDCQTFGFPQSRSDATCGPGLRPLRSCVSLNATPTHATVKRSSSRNRAATRPAVLGFARCAHASA